VGEAKFERYGMIFLQIIRKHCAENNLEERPKVKATPRRTKKNEPEFKPRHILFGETYNQGRPLRDLMSEYGIKLSTALDYLYKFHQAGNQLRADGLLSLSDLSEGERQKVLNVFNKLGTQRLRPVFDALNGEIGYEELHLMRLFYLGK
jgi:ATP-dependent DNA helicase RecQ